MSYRIFALDAGAVNSGGFVLAHLWNPAGSGRRLKITEIAVGESDQDASSPTLRWTLQRVTVRGTPASTITPDIDSDSSADLAPPSGALLDLGPFSVEPTIDAPGQWGPLIQSFSSTQMQPFTHLPLPRGIWVPEGFGYGIIFNGGGVTMTNHHVSFEWEES